MNRLPILAFIEARLAEDAELANAATAGPWSVDDERYAEEISAWTGKGDFPVVAGQRQSSPTQVFASNADAIHIARHHPDRVLRQVSATRAIIAAHPLAAYTDEEPGFSMVVNDHVCPGGQTPCTTLRALASVWADHPDYQAEWTP